MTRKVEITVWNKLQKERRDINVYHHSNRSSHIISCNNSLTKSMNLVEERDYLHISVARGPGYLTNYCVLDLPSFLDFKFSLTGEVTLIHSGKRTLLRIPPGPPLWELKMIISGKLAVVDSLNGNQVNISDSEEWNDELEEK